MKICTPRALPLAGVLLLAAAASAGGCIVMPVVGPEEGQSRLMFTPDSRSVVSIRDKSVAFGLFMGDNVFGLVPYDFEVQVIPVGEGEARTIHVRGIAPDNGLVRIEETHFSPSGRRLALVGACGSAVVDLDAGTHQWLDPPGKWITHLGWRSDEEVVYIAGGVPLFVRGTQPPHEVYRHKLSGQDAGREKLASQSASPYSVGPSGSAALFRGGSLLDVSAGRTERLPPGEFRQMAFSPDGTNLAVCYIPEEEVLLPGAACKLLIVPQGPPWAGREMRLPVPGLADPEWAADRHHVLVQAERGPRDDYLLVDVRDFSVQSLNDHIEAALGRDAVYRVGATDCPGWLLLVVWNEGQFYIDHDVRHVIPVPRGPAGEELGWATLSADGRHVAGLGEKGEVLIVPIDLPQD